MKNLADITVIKFLKLLFKEWILWIILSLDVLFVFVQIIFPKFSPPYFIYILIAIIGVVWASYKIYNGLIEQIPQSILDKILTSKVQVSFVEGNEYHYKFGKWDVEKKRNIDLTDTLYPTDENNNQRERVLPNTQLSLFLRIENIGETSVNIISVNGNIHFKQPFNFMLSDSLDLEDNEIVFPVKLALKKIIQFKLVFPIFPFSPMNEAQIAARTKNIIHEKIKVNANVSVEFINPKGEIVNCSESISISLLPLCDLYRGFWTKIERIDLVNLVND
ncbi:MAG: hypothetical protein WC699_04790 [Bacteroidales bacterium]|jgi:hypothetical protein